MELVFYFRLRRKSIPVALLYEVCKLMLRKCFYRSLGYLFIIFLNGPQFQPLVSAMEYLHKWGSILCICAFSPGSFLSFPPCAFSQQEWAQTEAIDHKGWFRSTLLEFLIAFGEEFLLMVVGNHSLLSRHQNLRQDPHPNSHSSSHSLCRRKNLSFLHQQNRSLLKFLLYLYLSWSQAVKGLF